MEFIEPNSSINVELEIDEMLFIGDYSEQAPINWIK